MEWTSAGRLLASEHSASSVKDVTDGGDMAQSNPYASGLRGPASILPRTNGQLLVAETWAGSVVDIQGGGEMTGKPRYISELSAPYSLLETLKYGEPRLFVSEHYNGRNSWIRDITNPISTSVYVNNIPARPGAPAATPLESWDDEWQKFAASNCVINWQGGGGGSAAHYLAIGSLGQILDIKDEGGEYIDLLKNKKAIAWDLGRLGAIKEHPNGLLYAVESELGDVVAVDPKHPMNYRFQPPVVRGFNRPTCIRFSEDGMTMFVCSQGDGCVWKVIDFQ
jgi:hypothetical protein